MSVKGQIILLGQEFFFTLLFTEKQSYESNKQEVQHGADGNGKQ